MATLPCAGAHNVAVESHSGAGAGQLHFHHDPSSRSWRYSMMTVVSLLPLVYPEANYLQNREKKAVARVKPYHKDCEKGTGNTDSGGAQLRTRDFCIIFGRRTRFMNYVGLLSSNRSGYGPSAVLSLTFQV